MNPSINYDKRVQKALKSMVKLILQEVSVEGLPGNHHFYISFATQTENVEVSDWLIEKYPDVMTIIIQNWFADLHVDDNYFSITLNFNNRPEKMIIPFNSLKSFSDPSVDFNIEFTHTETDNNKIPQNLSSPSKPGGGPKSKELKPLGEEMKTNLVQEEQETSGQVISLDEFRKR